MYWKALLCCLFYKRILGCSFLPEGGTPQWEGGVVSALYVLQIRVQCCVHFFFLGTLREFLWCICSWHYTCMQPRLPSPPEFLTLNSLLLLSGFQVGSIHKTRSVKTKIFLRAHRTSVVFVNLSAPSSLPFLRPVVRAPCFLSSPALQLGAQWSAVDEVDAQK